MLPEPGAKGHSVFVPTLAMAPLTKENDNSDDMALPVTHMGPVIVNNSANSNQHGNGDNISIDNDSTTNSGLNTPLIVGNMLTKQIIRHHHYGG
jgi:hypothetical protein